MATPSYQGSGQPTLDSAGGLLGRLGSMFGTTTPVYAGAGQPSSTGGALSRVTPAYAPAPAEPSIDEASQPMANSVDLAELTAALAAGRIVIAIPRTECPIDPAALAAGQIAIVVPRDVRDSDDVIATD